MTRVMDFADAGKAGDVAAGVTAAERGNRAEFVAVSPAMAFVGIMLVLPLGWLFVLSWMDENGSFTIHNYAVIFQDRSYVASLWLTAWMSMFVTAACIVLGYALAFALTLTSPRMAAIGLALVALPFWTSVLVRTYAWMVLLQSRGVVNNALMKLQIIAQPIYMSQNLSGALIGMLHIMLPFMVFTLYASLKRVDLLQVNAALSLGASPFYAFRRVYLPQTWSGIMAGTVLVFVTSLGFYITPALLGGGKASVMAIIIERDINFNRTWGPASAVSMLFLIVAVGLFSLLSRRMPLSSVFVQD